MLRITENNNQLTLAPPKYIFGIVVLSVYLQFIMNKPEKLLVHTCLIFYLLNIKFNDSYALCYYNEMVLSRICCIYKFKTKKKQATFKIMPFCWFEITK